MLRKLLSLGSLMAALLFFTTCGSSKATFLVPPNASTQAPSLAELSALLSAELARLGKDPSKVTSAAPSGSDNAVFDLSARVIGDGGTSSVGTGVPPVRNSSSAAVPGCGLTNSGQGRPPSQMGGTGGPPVYIKQTSAITGIELSWTERIIGDYDQNGEVNLSDLAPLAINWGTNVLYDDPAMHGGFKAWPTGDLDSAGALNWRMGRVDGDSNGEISGSDITQIAIHFKEVNHGYQIERAVNYGTGTLDWEALPVDIGFGIQPSAPRNDVAIYSNDTPVRYAATVPIALPEFAHYFRVKPYDEISGASGEVSNVVAYLPSPTTDTVPPYWLDAVGVAKLLPGNESMTVEFGAATDDTSPPVTYRVYWAEGDEANPDAPFDYGAAQTMDVASSPYTITGLTNDQYYRVAVRAIDSADVPNIEANTVLLGRKAGATDIYPPEWQGETGLRELYYGNGMAVLVWDSAIDSHTDEYGTWENNPVTYRVYTGLGSQPDFRNSEVYEFADLGLDSYVVPIRDLDTTVTRWFAVRAFDQAEVGNEDGNTRYRSASGITSRIIDQPGLGPGVDEAATPGGLRFAFNKDRSQLKAIRTGRVPTTGDDYEQWLSIWGYNGTEFIHELDDLPNPGGEFDYRHPFVNDANELEFLSPTRGLVNPRMQHYQQGQGWKTEYELDGNYHHQLSGFSVFGEPWSCLIRVDMTNFPASIDQYYSFSYMPMTNPIEYRVKLESGSFYNGTTYASLSNGTIAWMSWDDETKEQFKVTMTDEVSLELYSPPEVGTTLASHVYGSDISEPIWLEENKEVPGHFWWRWSNSSTQVQYRDMPPLVVEGRTWDVIDLNHIGEMSWRSTENYYESPGESTYLISTESYLGGDRVLIPLGDDNDLTINYHNPPYLLDADHLAFKFTVGEPEQRKLIIFSKSGQ